MQSLRFRALHHRPSCAAESSGRCQVAVLPVHPAACALEPYAAALTRYEPDQSDAGQERSISISGGRILGLATPQTWQFGIQNEHLRWQERVMIIMVSEATTNNNQETERADRRFISKPNGRRCGRWSYPERRRGGDTKKPKPATLVPSPLSQVSQSPPPASGIRRTPARSSLDARSECPGKLERLRRGHVRVCRRRGRKDWPISRGRLMVEGRRSRSNSSRPLGGRMRAGRRYAPALCVGSACCRSAKRLRRRACRRS